MDIRIAEFEESLYDEVRNLVFSVLKSVGLKAEKYPKFIEDISLRNILHTYQGRSRFWVAFADDKIIGTAAIEEKDAETAKLKRMFVLPEYHGKNIGPQLMNTALGFSLQNGYNKIIIKSDKMMHRAHRFYERNGFKRIDEDTNRFFYERSLE